MPHRRDEKLPLLLSVEKIWDRDRHSALTDLIRFHGKLLCVFRESDSHYLGRDGVLRIISSENGVVWNPQAFFEWEGWDLRDPKLSITPNGQLMLLAAGSRFQSKTERTAHTGLAAFSENGVDWTPFTRLDLGEEWLWRVTWHKGIGYGAAYYFKEKAGIKGSWSVKLYQTEDGIEYRLITEWPIPGRPNETTIRFLPNDQMVALVRRNGAQMRNAWIGTSFPPYEDWLWNETGYFIGGPDFFFDGENRMWAAGRTIACTPYGSFEKMALWKMTLKELEPLLLLPSFGDCSYPGLVYEPPHLFMSYYSSHGDNASIYFASLIL